MRDVSFEVPQTFGAVEWLVTRGVVPVAASRLRLGVNDFLSRQHFSPPAP